MPFCVNVAILASLQCLYFKKHGKPENSPVGGPLNAVPPILCLMYFSSKCHETHRSSKVGSRQINVLRGEGGGGGP